jgi:hypothetical protein
MEDYIRNRCEVYGFHPCVVVDKGEYVELQEVMLPRRLWRHGYGTRFMNEICAEADKRQVVLGLDPEPVREWGTKQELARWYQRFGFVASPDPDLYRVSYVRMPRQPVEAPASSAGADACAEARVSRTWVGRCIRCTVYVAILVYMVLSILAAVFVISAVAPTWSFFHEYEVFSLSVLVTFPLWSRQWVTNRIKPLIPRSIDNVPILIVMGAVVYLLAHLLGSILTTW